MSEAYEAASRRKAQTGNAVPDYTASVYASIGTSARIAAEKMNVTAHGITDAGLAKTINGAFAGYLRYGVDTGAWYAPAGPRWEEMEPEVFTNALSLALRCKKDDEDDAKRWNAARGRLATAVGQSAVAKCQARDAKASGQGIRVADLDSEEWLLWTPGGAWDLRTGKPAEEGTYCPVHLKVTAYAPEEGITPAWDELTGIMWPDPDVRAYAIRVIAQRALFGTASKQNPVLDGPPGTAKSTFAQAIHDVLGNYAVQVNPEKIIGHNATGNAAEEERAPMLGARLVWLDEPPGRSKQAISAFNELASGAGTIAASAKYKSRMQAPKRYTLLVCQNASNALDLSAEGVSERVLVIPCVNHVSEELRNRFVKAFKGEAPAILAKLIAECAQEPLEEPLAVVEHLTGARTRADDFGEWMEEGFIPVVGHETSWEFSAARLRKMYNGQLHPGDGRPVGSTSDLIERLLKLGYQVKATENGRNMVGIRGRQRSQWAA